MTAALFFLTAKAARRVNKMNVKKILMWAGLAIAVVLFGLAVVNRAKKQFPMISKIIGE